MVEQLTLNQLVLGSSPRGATNAIGFFGIAEGKSSYPVTPAFFPPPPFRFSYSMVSGIVVRSVFSPA